MPKTSPHVIIAGAGIGGLTAALALLKSGIDCDLYEQAPELREVGAGLQLAPNGTRVLFALGLEPSVRREGVETGDKTVRLWSTGQTWSLFDPDRGDADRAVRLADVPDASRRPARHAGRCGSPAEARRHPSQFALRRFRAGRIGGAPDARRRPADRRRHPDRRRRAAFTHPPEAIRAGDAEIHRHHGLARPRAGGAPSRASARPVATQWLGPNGHVTCYPVHRGKLLNMVGEVERDDWQLESWVEPGRTRNAYKDFPGWHRDLLDIIDSIDTLYKWGLFLREPLPKWSVGRVTLLGDSCHAMLPFLGQGANMAIEDGFVLARCVEKYRDDPVGALQRYEAARRERTTDVVQRSANMAATFHNDALSDSEAGANTSRTNGIRTRSGRGTTRSTITMRSRRRSEALRRLACLPIGNAPTGSSAQGAKFFH